MTQPFRAHLGLALFLLGISSAHATPDLEQKLFTESERLLEAKQTVPVRSRLNTLRRLRPKDPKVALLEARLADLEGKPSRALSILSQIPPDHKASAETQKAIDELRLTLQNRLALESSQHRGTHLESDWEVLRLDGRTDELLLRLRDSENSGSKAIDLKQALERSAELMVAFASATNSTLEPLGRQDEFERIATSACAQSLMPSQKMANLSLEQALFELKTAPRSPIFLSKELRLPLFGMTRFKLVDEPGNHERFRVSAALVTCRDPKAGRVKRLQWRGWLEASAIWEETLASKIETSLSRSAGQKIRAQRLNELAVRALRMRRLQVESYRSRLLEDQSQKLVTQIESSQVESEIKRQIEEISIRLKGIKDANRVQGSLGANDQLLIRSLYRLDSR